uniref:Hyaluronan/mRNA-binding protein domain-containing protein n=5 Tax=Triticinae TaxID=1648030 RepID=A0A452Y5W6_AEGTS
TRPSPINKPLETSTAKQRRTALFISLKSTFHLFSLLDLLAGEEKGPAMDGGKKSRDPYKLPQERRDRKSGSGMSGDAKKGGRGGKFTWEGTDGYTDEDLDLIGNKGRGTGASDNKKS